MRLERGNCGFERGQSYQLSVSSLSSLAAQRFHVTVPLITRLSEPSQPGRSRICTLRKQARKKAPSVSLPAPDGEKNGVMDYGSGGLLHHVRDPFPQGSLLKALLSPCRNPELKTGFGGRSSTSPIARSRPEGRLRCRTAHAERLYRSCSSRALPQRQDVLARVTPRTGTCKQLERI